MEQNKVKNLKNYILSFCMTFLIMLILCSCGIKSSETDVQTSPAVFKESTTETTAQSTTATSEIQNTESEKSTTKQTEKAVKINTEKKSEEALQKQISCTLEISCASILKKKEDFEETKSEFLPESGEIISSVKVTVSDGSTAFDVIKKACAENVCTDNCKFCIKNGIHLDYVYTPGYDSYYIRGIHQIYEKDCGTQSGWMYCVNGTFPNFGCSQYKVKDGDVIKFMYTCDSGDDINAEY